MARDKSRAPSIVGENLAAARRRAGMTQSELAEASHVNITTIARIEAGLTETANTATLERLAEALGISPAELWVEPRSDISAERLVKQFLESGFGCLLTPPVGYEDIERLKSVPSSFWVGKTPSPKSILHLIEMLRAATPQRSA